MGEPTTPLKLNDANHTMLELYRDADSSLQLCLATFDATVAYALPATAAGVEHAEKVADTLRAWSDGLGPLAPPRPRPPLIWIFCDERMPPDGTIVFYIDNDGSVGAACWDNHAGEAKSWWEPGRGSITNVVGWVPIPEMRG